MKIPSVFDVKCEAVDTEQKRMNSNLLQMFTLTLSDNNSITETINTYSYVSEGASFHSQASTVSKEHL